MRDVFATCRTRLGVGILLLAATACGAPTSNRAADADEPPASTIGELHRRARAEGAVVVWGPQNRELDWIPAAFNERYPGIEVSWAADRAAGTRVVAEFRAGRHAVDVFHFSLGGMLPVARRDILGTNDWSLFGIDDTDVFLDGSAAATHNLLYSVVYNTELVDERELPDAWEDLLDPRWKNRLVASQFLLPRLLGFLALEWGEARAEAFARALIRDQNTLITRTPREGVLERGERVLAVGDFIGSAMYWRSLGLPTGWVALSPVPATQFAVAPLARAPHPNAARLLAGWMASAEAKTLRERLRFEADVRPGSPSPLAARLAADNVTYVFEDVSTMMRRAALYERFSPIVRGQLD